MNYLYNGVELPALPKLAYPHAIIANTTESYWLFVSESEMYIYPSGVTTYIGTPCLQYKHLDGEWVEGEYGTVANSNTLTSVPVWANHDVLNEDGTLYLAAGDPVPVSTIDPKSLMMGWRVGQLIRGLRK